MKTKNHALSGRFSVRSLATVWSGLKTFPTCLSLLVLLALQVLPALANSPTTPPDISQSALDQIQALTAEKATWTPVQRKMESQLIHASKAGRGEAFAPGAPFLQMDVKFQEDGRILVDIDCTTVTQELLDLLAQDGGTVVNSVPQFNAVRALVTVSQLETLAARSEVTFLRRASEAFTNTGSVDSQGDTTHNAIAARNTFGAYGNGITVGVLSDGCDFYTNSQTSGDLPNPITILPGQSGIPSTGEGTAMMEIVHDLAPNSPLQFATAFISEAQFAQNIINLWSNGCNIIVDDVGYFDEPPFQDGIVAQAVNTVTTGGALYFSSAANSGNIDSGTSGTWEGDFVDGGAAGPPISGVEPVRLHNFGGQTYDVCTGGSSLRADLFWADPWVNACDDYDLFVLNSTGTTVLFSSIAGQSCPGTSPPHEACSLGVNDRIVIGKYNGSGVFLHLATGRGHMSIATSGATVGHSAATNAFSTAAISIASAYPGLFTGGGANPFETFTSDGLRHVFFQADGTPITPGNYSSTGGAIRNKPDIAAADGVATATPGFNPFYGTSAAAPHAAAIAAMLWSANYSLTPAQIRSLLINSALDVNPAGYDRDTGYGIVMPYNAIHSMAPGNDTCGGAIIINTIYYANSESTAYADSTGDPSPSCIYQPGHGVWYQFTAPITAQFQIDTIGSDYDTCLAIYTGSCGAFSQIACDDDSGGNFTSKIILNATAGTTYYILAGGYNGYFGNQQFHLNYLAPPNTTAIQASDKGWYDSTGAHSPGNDNYYCGELSPNGYHNFFVFNVPGYNIQSAQLLLRAYQVATPYGTLAYVLRDVTTPIATLEAGGTGLTAIYNDLGNGASYGYRSITPADANTTISIPLNAAFLSAVAATNGGLVALGGSITNLNSSTIGDEYAFSFSQGLPDDAILVVTYNPTIENASFTGWYDNTGLHNAANHNYVAGSSPQAYRDFFVFDVPYFSSSVVNAELLVNTYTISSATAGPETYLLRDVTTPIPSLISTTTNVSTYADLATGVLYGIRDLSVSESAMQAIIPLNASFINALMASQGGQIALGGSLANTPLAGSDYAFGFSQGNLGDVKLRLTFGTSLVVNANARGWYDATGFHNPANSNYVAGAQSGTFWHNFFVFPVPTLGAQVVNAQLLLNSYVDTTSISAGFYAAQRYSLHDVTTPIPTLEAGGSGLTAIYNDLANGADYGGRNVYTNESGFVSAIPLNSTFWQAAQSASGSQIALGGSLPDLSSSSTFDFLFGFSNGAIASDAQLWLGLAANWPHSPVLQPPFRHLANGNFQFSVNGTAASYEIDATTDLKGWDVLGSLTMTNPVSVYTDTATTGKPYRYYRARYVP